LLVELHRIGGDVIALTAHIRGTSVKEAADQLDRALGGKMLASLMGNRHCDTVELF
jgi:hypothetical protein